VKPSQVDLATSNRGEGPIAARSKDLGLWSKFTSIMQVIGRICFTSPEICFILLPLRHSKDRNTIYRSLSLVQGLRSKDHTDSYLRRFHYATVKSLADITVPSQVVSVKHPVELIGDLGILDQNCKYSDRETTHLAQNVIRIANEFKSYVPNTAVTVSLSGGVDSMVSAFILKHLGYDVTAVHINYNNRDVCEQEVKMMGIWCQTMRIPLYVRTIKEIQRNQKYDREFYEQVTRDIRFKAYQFLDKPVILGHNRDDCLENIISNIKRCQNYDNLTGMKHVSYQQAESHSWQICHNCFRRWPVGLPAPGEALRRSPNCTTRCSHQSRRGHPWHCRPCST
jgi:hypothetical protein